MSLRFLRRGLQMINLELKALGYVRCNDMYFVFILCANVCEFGVWGMMRGIILSDGMFCMFSPWGVCIPSFPIQNFSLFKRIILLSSSSPWPTTCSMANIFKSLMSGPCKEKCCPTRVSLLSRTSEECPRNLALIDWVVSPTYCFWHLRQEIRYMTFEELQFRWCEMPKFLLKRLLRNTTR